MKPQGGLIIAITAILAGSIAGAPARGREAAPPAVGFVAGIQGEGYIIRDRDTIMISGMDLLYPGDSVRLPGGSAARITICGGRGYQIRGNAGFTIGRSGVSFKRGKAFKTYAVDRKACAAALEVFRKNEKKLPEMVTGERKGTLMLRSRKKSERRGVYVVRGRKQVPVIELFSDRLMPRKPLLIWTPVAGRISYRVVIKSGDETTWSSTVMKNSCEYPEGAPRLAEARVYDIVIEAVADQGNVVARGTGSLSLFSRDELESLRQDETSIRAMMPDSSPERYILLGKLFEAHGQLADALGSYEKALSLDSGNAGLKERVALLKKIME